MEMAVRLMETAEMAMETDGDGSGALPRPSRVPEQRLLSPEIRWRWRQSYGTASGKLPTPLGFSVPRLLIGKGASSGDCQGALTPRWRGQGQGRAGLVCRALVAPLRLLFGSLEASGQNKTSETCFIQFREYFLCSFSEIQKQQKTENWHCGILSIG
jgi:hypothetical protein